MIKTVIAIYQIKNIGGAVKVVQILDQRAFQVGSFTDLNVLNTSLQPCHLALFAVADKGFLGIIQLSFISAQSIKYISRMVYLSHITEYNNTI